ncbi:MAG: hypothetical protein ABR874_04085 [Candidatus Sulfotelmatobacter sp.]|jgi:hypothetical protein
MNSRQTKTFIGAIVLAAIASITYAAMHSHTLNPFYALAVLALAAATSRMKVKLPGIEGNMSVNLPFLLMAVMTLSAVEAVLIACLSTVVQCWPKSNGKFRPEQMLFNVSMMGLATSMANLVFSSAWGKASWASQPLMLAATTATFFLGQTVPVAAIIKLTQGESLSLGKVWMSIAQMSFPYFVLSTGVTSMLNLVSNRFGWQAALVVFPVMYGIHHSYRLYFSRAEQGDHRPGLARAAAASA